MMEGLESFGLGYWLMDVVHFSKDHEMTPLFNKLYSFDHGAKSENKEIMEAIQEVDSIIDKDELRNFIYYKISTIIKTLLANMTPKAFLPHPKIPKDDGQLCLALNYEF